MIQISLTQIDDHSFEVKHALLLNCQNNETWRYAHLSRHFVYRPEVSFGACAIKRSVSNPEKQLLTKKKVTMKPGKTILAIIIAATAGLLTGFLFAPEKGRRIRRKIIEKGEDSFDNLKDDISQSVRELKKKLDASSCVGCESDHRKSSCSSEIAFQSSL